MPKTVLSWILIVVFWLLVAAGLTVMTALFRIALFRAPGLLTS